MFVCVSDILIFISKYHPSIVLNIEDLIYLTVIMHSYKQKF